VEGDSPTLKVVSAGSLGKPIHGHRTTGGANQRLLVSVRRDQNQRFRRAVFLDAPTSHSRPFRRGLVARNWLPPTRVNLGNLTVWRKGRFRLWH
jgi:hypothetical protein